jgi:hypothetical protein
MARAVLLIRDAITKTFIQVSRNEALLEGVFTVRLTLAILVIVFGSSITAAQTTGAATTNGTCSIANSGNNNSSVVINCGVGVAQGRQILAILNTMLEHQIDPAAVMKKLDEVLAAEKQAAAMAPKPITVKDLPNEYLNAIEFFIEVRPDVPYPEGTMVNGFPWKPEDIQTTLSMTPKVKISNVDLTLSFDALFVHAGQVSKVPGVILQPKADRPVINDWEGGSLDENGKPIKMYAATPEEMKR